MIGFALLSENRENELVICKAVFILATAVIQQLHYQNKILLISYLYQTIGFIAKILLVMGFLCFPNTSTELNTSWSGQEGWTYPHIMILSNNILYTDFLSILAARGDRILKECINT